MTNIEGRESPEMYLKAVYMIRKEKGYCRSVDVAHYLDVSKPSVSIAINKLKNEGFLMVDGGGGITLTEEGQKRAQIVYDKFQFWSRILKKFGMNSEKAEAEACRFEHVTSDEAFMEIRYEKVV